MADRKGGAMKRVYLCGAINGKTDAECKEWRSRARHLLGGSFVVLDPMARDYRGVEDENVAAIVDGDIADVESADYLLVNANAPSWGTAMEVRHAKTIGKGVVAFMESSRVSPWLRYHCDAIYDSVDRACMAVLNFDVLVSRE